mmetsp:Transcript_32578/g.68088  ORF Transcript_32578/g.68088 Transcript_32578/m.68088 type:complete len:254 (-) Transcript_32578:53-814(-)
MRTGNRRLRHRDGSRRSHSDRRDPIRRLHLPRHGSAVQRGRQVQIPQRRPIRRRGTHRSHAIRRCRARRAVPLAVARGLLRPHPGPRRRRPPLPGPGQGLTAGEHPRPQPGRLPGAQGPLPRRRRGGADGGLRPAAARRRRDAGGRRRDRRGVRGADAGAAGGVRSGPGRARRRLRAHRPSHRLPLGRRHRLRQRRQDGPLRGESRGAHHVRVRSGGGGHRAGAVLPTPRGPRPPRLRLRHPLPPGPRALLPP